MTDLRTAAQQALEALEWISDCHVGDDDDAGECASCHERSYKPHASDCKKNNAITALRAALAQEQAEPQCTPAWWRDGLTATLMREGINKHRAREIADGYWQAYCEIGDSDD